MMTGDPGLNVVALQGLRRSRRDVPGLRARIEAHLGAHDGYLAFSGGKDSLVVLDLVRQVDRGVPVVFFDSGLEFPETYQYLAQLAQMWGLNFQVIPPRLTALELLAGHGGWDHRGRGSATPGMHQVLITEPAAKAHAMFGAGELWGVRAQESRGRAAAYTNGLRAASCACEPRCDGRQRRARHGGRIARVDGTVVFGPVWDWKTDEIWGHISRHLLPVNPVYAKLRRLGAPEHFLRVSMMVEAHRLEEGRITWLRRGWPELFEELAVILPRLREYV